MTDYTLDEPARSIEEQLLRFDDVDAEDVASLPKIGIRNIVLYALRTGSVQVTRSLQDEQLIPERLRRAILDNSIRKHTDPIDAFTRAAIALYGTAGDENYKRLAQVIAPLVAPLEKIAEALSIEPGSLSDEQVRKVFGDIATDVSRLARTLATKVELDRFEFLSSPPTAENIDSHDELSEQLAEWKRTQSLAERGGMLAWDAALADVIASTGAGGVGLAKDVREGSRKRWATREKVGFGKDGTPAPGAIWKLWNDPTRDDANRFINLLAAASWADVVRPKLEHERARLPAGLARVVASDQIIATMTRQTVIPTLDDGTVRDASGKTIGRITLTTDASIEAVRNGLASFGTVAGNRLVRGLVHRAHDQRDAGIADFRRVAFEGGFAAMLDALNLGRNYGDTIREIAIAGSAVQWTTPHADGGGFWTWSSRRGSRKGPGEVAFVLGDPLLPGYVSGLARLNGSSTLTGRRNRRFVPELRGEVPIPKMLDASKHGSVWTLHRMMIVELVDQARDLATNGYATITPERTAELARLAGLTRQEDITRVLNTFTDGDGTVAPIFKRDGDGWTLADPHGKEREYIIDRGRAEISGQRRGKQASKTRLEGPRNRRRKV